MHKEILKKYITSKLKEISNKNQFRDLIVSDKKKDNIIIRNNKKLISFSCNDYLLLSKNKLVIKESINAAKKYGTGSGASKLITGYNPLNKVLEEKLAKIKNKESCAIFGSGYLANLGVISCLAKKNDLILIDEYSHSCSFMGSQLSGAKVILYKHNNISDLKEKITKYRKRYKNCYILSEGVFSMDGDLSPLDKISKIKHESNSILIIDDAHGFGVIGSGTGTDSFFNAPINIDIYIGTLSKSIGSYGGYVCSDKKTISYFINRCRTQIYTTGLPPSVLAASIKALEIINTNKRLIKKPLDNANYFCNLMGFRPAMSPIVPIITHSEKKALSISKYLEHKGFLVGAIRPPTVPNGASRLRVAFNSGHTQTEIRRLTYLIKKALVKYEKL